MEKINDVLFIDVDKIVKNPNQPRNYFLEDSIEELSESIRQVGLIQPISVRKIGNEFELIAGERRLIATKKAGFKKIPTIVIDVDDNQSAILALVENIQRENLNFFDEAHSYKVLIKKYNITQKDLAIKIGKSQSSISNKLRLLKLENEIIQKIIDNKLTERHARILLKIKSNVKQNEVIDKVIKNQLNVKQTDVLVDKLLNDSKIEKRKKNTQYKFGSNIYVNTIKKAFNEIINVGIDAEFEKSIEEKYIELKIRIPR